LLLVWHWIEDNDTSRDENAAFLRRYARKGATDKRLAPFYAEHLACSGVSLTNAGISLIGRRKKQALVGFHNLFSGEQMRVALAEAMLNPPAKN